ncbi:response regulator transcription factor [Hymenobacter busanensis]|uniref:Response regulator transcription factor n=1 Tax=Hymenobacter busanensis TaxID=2607656 RepID=A0A7L4ZT41_9BACT|nr:LytTR family DNA-binding domain-containing protein [Hymenobacter busanensis]KAA9327569.1 response regulator transcription factor [Hymenobacter busanensis]QHJ06093.1 response regulator [Hymenobacter busanensis]
MKAIAIDDEPIALDVVRALAAKVPFVELTACFTDAFEALAYLQREPVELLFLDINMPDISGLELVGSLPRRPLVVFTTAYAEHAVQGFELDAIDYLLKPFSLARFVKACNKAQELLQLRAAAPAPTPARDYLFLKTGYEQVKVRFAEILYLEAAGNYITVVLPDQRLLTRMTMQEVLALLPAEQFARVHRSYVVNTARIDRIERHQVGVQGHPVPLGAAYQDQLRLG